MFEPQTAKEHRYVNELVGHHSRSRAAAAAGDGRAAAIHMNAFYDAQENASRRFSGRDVGLMKYATHLASGGGWALENVVDAPVVPEDPLLRPVSDEERARAEQRMRDIVAEPEALPVVDYAISDVAGVANTAAINAVSGPTPPKKPARTRTLKKTE